jgi:hypothetical protein
LSPDKAAARAGMPIDLHNFSLPEHDGSAPKGGDLKKRYDDLASQRDEILPRMNDITLR